MGRYIRFGDIPENERSGIYAGEEKTGEEIGVSVYPLIEDNGTICIGLSLPITRTSLYTFQHLVQYDNRPCYIVEGDYVGRDCDNQPLIKNVKVIKEINYRIAH